MASQEIALLMSMYICSAVWALSEASLKELAILFLSSSERVYLILDMKGVISNALLAH